MFKWFIDHQWKQFKRSTFWQKSVAANIGIGFLVLLMLSYLLMLGILIDKIILGIYPDSDPVVVFNGILLYYFALDLLIRYLMQALPTLTVEFYRHLPVKKSSLVNFVVNKNVLSVLNLMPLLVFIPFAIRGVTAYYSSVQALSWFFALFIMVFANNYLASYIKRQLTSKPAIVAIVGVILISVMVLDYYGLFALSEISAAYFGLFIQSPVYLAIPLVWIIFAYYLNYDFLKKRLYPEEISRKKRSTTDRLSRVRYFESMGLTGELMMLELKLWWRHKRTKSMLYMIPIFILYGFFFYPMEIYLKQVGMLIFVGVFMSGGLMISYLNYSFGYESNYFDGILTKEIDMEKYIRAKYIIGIATSAICFVLIIPYVYFGIDVLLINLVAFLFNVGFLSYVLLYMATFNKKRMDLAKGAAFNYQGVGAANWLAMVPAFLLPVLIYLPFGLTGNKYAGLLAVGSLGVLGFLFQKQVLRMIYKNFKRRKYIMAEGFRE